MFFLVQMEAVIPNDMDPTLRADLGAREKAYAQQLQRDGKLRDLWRVVGQHSNCCIFEVDSSDELHQLLWGLPLFNYVNIEVTALTTHGSKI